MDGAGKTIFERIEYKLSTMGIEVDNSDLREATKQVEAKIEGNPSDMDSKMVRLELKVVELARLLGAAVDALESKNGGAYAPVAVKQEVPAKEAPAPGKKVKKLRQNPATGIIEEIEETEADNVIVADARPKYKGGPSKDDKKCVFIAASDDEPVKATEPKRK